MVSGELEVLRAVGTPDAHRLGYLSDGAFFGGARDDDTFNDDGIFSDDGTFSGAPSRNAAC